MKHIHNIIQALFFLFFVLTTVLNAVGLDTNYIKLDSNKRVRIGDESMAVRISTPTTRMYRRADREIAINMNDDINAVSKPMINVKPIKDSDKIININFYFQYNLSLSFPSSEDDVYLTSLFLAENLTFDTVSLILSADKSIESGFHHENKKHTTE